MSLLHRNPIKTSIQKKSCLCKRQGPGFRLSLLELSFLKSSFLELSFLDVESLPEAKSGFGFSFGQSPSKPTPSTLSTQAKIQFAFCLYHPFPFVSPTKRQIPGSEDLSGLEFLTFGFQDGFKIDAKRADPQTGFHRPAFQDKETILRLLPLRFLHRLQLELLRIRRHHRVHNRFRLPR